MRSSIPACLQLLPLLRSGAPCAPGARQESSRAQVWKMIPGFIRLPMEPDNRFIRTGLGFRTFEKRFKLFRTFGACRPAPHCEFFRAFDSVRISNCSENCSEMHPNVRSLSMPHIPCLESVQRVAGSDSLVASGQW